MEEQLTKKQRREQRKQEQQEQLSMEKTKQKNKQFLIGLGIVAALVLVGWAIIRVASGGTYDLKVTDPVSGPEDAPIVLEEYFDFQCPACAAAAKTISQVKETFPTQVKVVYKDFPLPNHQFARPAAIGALCAAQQDQFDIFHDILFEQQQEWISSAGEVESILQDLANEAKLDKTDWENCRSSRDARREVNNGFAEGRDRGVTSTPTFYLDGEKIEGGQSLFKWIQLIEDKLEEKGITPENKVQEPETEESEGESGEAEAESAE